MQKSALMLVIYNVYILHIYDISVIIIMLLIRIVMLLQVIIISNEGSNKIETMRKKKIPEVMCIKC